MTVTCGTEVCYDDEAYCCYDTSGDLTCCSAFYYYQSWWFWFMWGMILLIIISCSVACYRSCNRRRRMRYVVLGQSEQPVYGSTVVVGTTGARVANAYTVMPGPTAPVAPPSYAQAQEKPPAYTPTQ